MRVARGHSVTASLIDLLHLAALVAVLLKRRQLLDVVGLVVVLDGEAELDHAVDAAGKGRRLVEREAGSQEARLEEQVDEVLDGLVALVGGGLGLELLHDAVLRVNLHRLLGGHVRRHRVVAERLGAHDALHVGGPAVLAGDEDARRLGDALRHDDLLNLIAEDLLHQLGERLEVGAELLPRLLLLLGLLKLEALLGDRDELLAVVLLELLHAVLVNGVNHEEHLVVALLALLNEGRGLDGLLGLAGDVVNVLLRLGHARDVVLERRLLVARLGRVVHEQLRELGAVARVLVDAELDVLAKLLVELLEVSAFSWISPKSSMHFLTMFFLITLRILFCCSVSREMLSGRSSESTTPLTKVSHSGIRSSQLSMMKTRRTYSLMWPEFFFFGSNRSKGARLGTKRMEVNSSWPSTLKCFTARCSSQSLESAL